MLDKLLFRSAALAALASLIGTAHAAVTLDWVTVGDPGNAGELSGTIAGPDAIVGGVDYTYRIAKYEVTNAQYAEFLNAVADSDPNGLYNPSMAGGGHNTGGITRSGTAANYTYAVRTNRSDRPVVYVSWYDTLRFANWLHNGQPTGLQDDTTTEDGAYDMDALPATSDVRKPGATVFLPSEDEWYKAAHYKGGGTNTGYWDYPTGSDTAPHYVNDAGNLSGTGAAFVEAGTDPGGYATYNGDAGTHGIGDPYWMTEVGEWENSASPYGTYDQGGNAWEWNEVLLGTARGARGGAYYLDFNNALHAGYRTTTGNPRSEYWDVGFRVASIPEPTNVVPRRVFHDNSALDSSDDGNDDGSRVERVPSSIGVVAEVVHRNGQEERGRVDSEVP